MVSTHTSPLSAFIPSVFSLQICSCAGTGEGEIGGVGGVGGGLLRKTVNFLMFLCIQLACIKVLGVDPYLHICSYCLQDLSPVPAVA